ncbi:hypothetical protein H310_12618 [Aphanomyces invadans]|uniref:Transmembrane protein n=1 Tax=Aphanomyces invadans TaxID=157072 RepID=A0A024TH23_9STRA|nr:hypothetical protein H310_12618 [Aphanomyces invadans]ETV93353.1 hypothetical protein H310_12618 [Aphanomyces invadans]|eukprot:XP_008877989.1 hypothetical protein H310_12618 [Aphanomyces invadans]
MYEWVEGKREVFTFEGDEGAFTTISPSKSSVPLAANPLELPQNACNYVRYIITYVTFALSGVAVVLVGYAAVARFQLGGLQLLQFNRVVGSVWIGRPFLLLRGMTAVVMLSTANMVFVVTHGFSHLQLEARSIVDIAVLAGETTWVSYTIIDFCLPFLGDLSAVLSPISALVGWLVVVILELADPVAVAAAIDTKCKAVTVDNMIECSVGSFTIGNSTRLVWICVIHLIAVGVATACAVGWTHFRHQRSGTRTATTAMHHLLIPMAAQSYLVHRPNDRMTQLDNVSCVMSGMIPLVAGLFDAKLWGYIPLEKRSASDLFLLPNPTFRTKSQAGKEFVESRQQRIMRFMAIVGLGYIAMTLAGSYGYLILTESTMANDFWWATFNTTGAQTYLSMVFTSQLQLSSRVAPTQIDTVLYGDTGAWYGAAKTSIATSPLYATAIENEAHSLSNVVVGLRKMDGCQVPWIFSAYCYVDFDRRWEMANSAGKQTRCLSEKTNGAVYLESILRNAQWNDLMSCWGDDLNTAVFAPIGATNDGKAWLQATQTNALTVADEVNLWTAKGITTYATQWQNFKRPGVMEFVSIRNAFGISYPITIKKSNGTFRLASQYTYKMYWGLANDLLATRENSSLLSGKSFVRASRNYAFENTSMEQVLVGAGYMPSVLGRNMATLRSILGPFGSIDVRGVPCPPSVRALFNSVNQIVTTVLARDDVHKYNYSAIMPTYSFAMLPNAWRGAGPPTT